MNLCNSGTCPAGYQKSPWVWARWGNSSLRPDGIPFFSESSSATPEKGSFVSSGHVWISKLSSRVRKIVMMNKNKKRKLHRGIQESKMILSLPILILHTIKALFQYGFNFIVLGLDLTLLYTALPNRAAPLVSYIYANVLACSDNYRSLSPGPCQCERVRGVGIAL